MGQSLSSALILAGLALASPALSHSGGRNPDPAYRSYTQLKTEIQRTAVSDGEKLPLYRSHPDFLAQFLLALARAPGVELVGRLRTTLSDPSDVKVDRPKVIHAHGVCGWGSWRMDEDSTPFTGLLSAGTRLPALVRLSTGDNAVSEGLAPRIFGMAVKVFPLGADTPGPTSNLFLMDPNGLDGDRRPGFLKNRSGRPVVFENTASAQGPAKIAAKLFGRFDLRPQLRPLYPFTHVGAGGVELPYPYALERITLTPFPEDLTVPLNASDFRRELLALDRRPGPVKLRFQIEVPIQDGSALARKIGTLELENLVVSTFCDRQLHFHHHPTLDTTGP